MWKKFIRQYTYHGYHCHWCNMPQIDRQAESTACWVSERWSLGLNHWSRGAASPSVQPCSCIQLIYIASCSSKQHWIANQYLSNYCSEVADVLPCGWLCLSLYRCHAAASAAFKQHLCHLHLAQLAGSLLLVLACPWRAYSNLWVLLPLWRWR